MPELTPSELLALIPNTTIRELNDLVEYLAIRCICGNTDCEQCQRYSKARDKAIAALTQQAESVEAWEVVRRMLSWNCKSISFMHGADDRCVVVLVDEIGKPGYQCGTAETPQAAILAAAAKVRQE